MKAHRLTRLEQHLGSYCSECPHCNPVSQQETEELDKELREVLKAIDEQAACDLTQCPRRAADDSSDRGGQSADTSS